MEYRKRKRRKKKPKKGSMKMVRVDDKTEIEVSIDIPDEVAKENYLKNLIESKPNKQRSFGRKK